MITKKDIRKSDIIGHDGMLHPHLFTYLPFIVCDIYPDEPSIAEAVVKSDYWDSDEVSPEFAVLIERIYMVNNMKECNILNHIGPDWEPEFIAEKRLQLLLQILDFCMKSPVTDKDDISFIYKKLMSFDPGYIRELIVRLVPDVSRNVKGALDIAIRWVRRNGVIAPMPNPKSMSLISMIERIEDRKDLVSLFYDDAPKGIKIKVKDDDFGQSAIFNANTTLN